MNFIDIYDQHIYSTDLTIESNTDSIIYKEDNRQSVEFLQSKNQQFYLKSSKDIKNCQYKDNPNFYKNGLLQNIITDKLDNYPVIKFISKNTHDLKSIDNMDSTWLLGFLLAKYIKVNELKTNKLNQKEFIVLNLCNNISFISGLYYSIKLCDNNINIEHYYNKNDNNRQSVEFQHRQLFKNCQNNINFIWNDNVNNLVTCLLNGINNLNKSGIGLTKVINPDKWDKRYNSWISLFSMFFYKVKLIEYTIYTNECINEYYLLFFHHKKIINKKLLIDKLHINKTYIFERDGESPIIKTNKSNIDNIYNLIIVI